MQALKSITQRMREQVADWSGPFLILHIGTHKTGTTWLQKLFLENRKLLSKNGLLLPDAGRDPRLGHSNNLGWELKRSWRFHPARGGWQALAEELRRCDPASSALISAESLGRIEEPEALRKIMDTARGSGRRVLVVVYLRDQPSYINSLYGQEVKRLLTGDSFERYVRDALVSNRFNHEHLLRVWEHLDEVALLPIPFAKCSMPLHRSFFGALEAAVGLSIPVEKLTLPEPRNESPGPGAVRLARSVHAALRGMACGKAERFAIYDALRREFIRRFTNETPFCGLDAALTEKIRDHFSESNHRVAARYWNCEWHELYPVETFQSNELPPEVPEEETPHLKQEIDRVIRRGCMVHRLQRGTLFRKSPPARHLLTWLADRFV